MKGATLKSSLERCTRCGDPVSESQTVCTCGSPTRFMTFEERAAYEVAQWRAYQERAAQAS
jgi:nitrate reductase cytochrome c-type subunit